MLILAFTIGLLENLETKENIRQSTKKMNKLRMCKNKMKVDKYVVQTLNKLKYCSTNEVDLSTTNFSLVTLYCSNNRWMPMCCYKQLPSFYVIKQILPNSLYEAENVIELTKRFNN